MRVVMVCLLVFASCVARSPKAPMVVESFDCGAPLDFSWKAGEVVLFGELHGTQEIPAFVGRVACQALQRGIPVQIGMEIFKEEQVALDAFVSSSGDQAAQDLLLQGAFWRRSYQDGRSSQAHLGLIRWAQQAKQNKLPVRVYAFDQEQQEGQAARETTMAKEINAQYQKAPNALHLILVGNLHARTKAGAPWDPSLVWMGVHLAASLPSLTTLNALYSGGEAWVCMGATSADCKATPMKGSAPTEKILQLFETPDESGYNGTFFVGELRASPPAVK